MYSLQRGRGRRSLRNRGWFLLTHLNLMTWDACTLHHLWFIFLPNSVINLLLFTSILNITSFPIFLFLYILVDSSSLIKNFNIIFLIFLLKNLFFKFSTFPKYSIFWPLVFITWCVHGYVILQYVIISSRLKIKTNYCYSMLVFKLKEFIVYLAFGYIYTNVRGSCTTVFWYLDTPPNILVSLKLAFLLCACKIFVSSFLVRWIDRWFLMYQKFM